VRLTDRLTIPQRIVVVVALGAACGAVGFYLAGLGNAGSFGWYAYAPLTSPHTGWPGWAHLIIWLALIVVWALVSVRVLRPHPAGPVGN
jgi:heme/copper-type cytochrome/quinol oxidase subunit 1